MNYVILDVETSTFKKGNPFSKRNKLCYVGLKPYQGESTIYETFESVDINSDSNCLVGFNIKFDLHWIRHAGIQFNKCSIWDLQIAEFILGYQKNPYPSLEETLNKYGLPPKDKTIDEKYWSQGIDTPDIPRLEMINYLNNDLKIEEALFIKQQSQFIGYPKLYQLFRVMCDDLLVLEEIEWNGEYYDEKESLERAEKLESRINEIDTYLRYLFDNAPINFNSTDHLSAILYGGKIIEEYKVPIGEYKSGIKIGQTRYKRMENIYEFPGLIKPIKGSELKKEGYYSADLDTLEVLYKKGNKQAKEIIELLLERSDLEKITGTYYRGLLKLREEMDWEPGILHGQLNQCVAITGRLSSTNPNKQNMDKRVKQLLISRYS